MRLHAKALRRSHPRPAKTEMVSGRRHGHWRYALGSVRKLG